MNKTRTAGLAKPNRRGATIVYTSIFLVVLFSMAAFAIEVGTMMVARAKMQAAADAAALAGASVLTKGETNALAKQYAGYHEFFGQPVALEDEDIKVGFWDDTTRTFSPDVNGNAVEVTAKIENVSLIFGSIIGRNNFSRQATSVAIAPARDIVFAVDLSGSMNDDTEPAWATSTINDMFDGTSFAGVGDTLIQNLFDDFGYGDYPSTDRHIGFTLGVTEDKYAYAEMTKDFGPLSPLSIPFAYRILTSDSEKERKEKCYSWIIDNEIGIAMPAAKPTPDSTVNYDYWEKYLDYIIRSAYVHSVPWESGGGSTPETPTGPVPPAIGFLLPTTSGQATQVRQTAFLATTPQTDTPGSPPIDRGWLPPGQDYDRIYRFNNPNSFAFPDGDTSTRWAMRNKIGYGSYVQFMLDYGREDKPDGNTYVPLSVESPDCPMHIESTDGGDFWFPPRTQPMHSCRRALISALNVIKTRNSFASPDQKDRVSIIAFDKLEGGVMTLQELTDDYDEAMLVCTKMQASVDKGRTTATEIGLRFAHDYIKPTRDGGSGRNNANKVVVLLTDGLPNDLESDPSDVDTYMTDNPNDDFYGGGFDWLDAPLMQTKRMSRKGWQVHPVGIGFGTDYDFMDRMARLGGTAQSGQSLHGSGNPAIYEERLRDLFRDIIEDPMVNLSK